MPEGEEAMRDGMGLWNVFPIDKIPGYSRKSQVIPFYLDYLELAMSKPTEWGAAPKGKDLV